MSVQLLLLLEACAVAAQTAKIVKFTPEQMQRTGAACMDGSPPAYYYADGNGNGPSADWHFHMEGGGDCTDEQDCKQRAGMCLLTGSGGSSNCFLPEELNGAVKGFNWVKIKYCSGDIHSGRVGLYEPWNVSFSGHLIVEEIVSSLKKNHGLADAHRVIVSGDSAGGIGAFAHADWFAEELPGSAVFAAPIAGLFYPNVTDFDTWKTQPDGGYEANPDWFVKHRLKIWDSVWDQFKPASCVAKHPKGSALYPFCGVVGFFATMIRVPLFVVDNQFDPLKTQYMGGTDDKSEQGIRYHQYFGKRVARSISDILAARKGNGAFVLSCADHDNFLPINGQSVNDAILEWVTAGGNKTVVVQDPCHSDDCLACNAANRGRPFCSCFLSWMCDNPHPKLPSPSPGSCPIVVPKGSDFE